MHETDDFDEMSKTMTLLISVDMSFQWRTVRLCSKRTNPLRLAMQYEDKILHLPALLGQLHTCQTKLQITY